MVIVDFVFFVFVNIIVKVGVIILDGVFIYVLDWVFVVKNCCVWIECFDKLMVI